MTEEYELYPHDGQGRHREEDMLKLEEILQEICEVLRHRSDGISIKIGRNTNFPKHRGKSLIEKIEIETWDIAA